MANTVTLAYLKEQARELADQESSSGQAPFVSDTTLVRWINEAYSELYDALVKANQNYYTAPPTTITVSSGNIIPYPADYYKLIGLDKMDGNGQFNRIDQFVMIERNKYQNLLLNNSFLVKYQQLKAGLYLLPEQNAIGTYKLWYVPTFTRLSADGDLVDGINGWEEFIIVTAAMKMMLKEESDISGLIAIRNNILTRIADMSQNRDQGQQQMFGDVYNSISSEDDFWWRK